MPSFSLRANPSLDSWIRLVDDGRVSVYTGKVELGQGIATALALIAAEELDVSPARIDLHTADTADGPNEFITAGSGSIEQSGSALRQAAAEARRILLERAAHRLGVPASRLQVDDGSVHAPGLEAVVTYWELMRGERFAGEVGEAATGSRRSQRGRSGRRAARSRALRIRSLRRLASPAWKPRAGSSSFSVPGICPASRGVSAEPPRLPI